MRLQLKPLIAEFLKETFMPPEAKSVEPRRLRKAVAAYRRTVSVLERSLYPQTRVDV